MRLNGIDQNQRDIMSDTIDNLEGAPEVSSEPILEPEIGIIDPHHHLWDGTALVEDSGTYLLPDFLEDAVSGHRIQATVYIEAQSMYRLTGPEEMRPVGEVEFANGVAAMSASGRYGNTQICAALVAFAELRLGERVADVLEAQLAAAGGRFARHSLYERSRPRRYP